MMYFFGQQHTYSFDFFVKHYNNWTTVPMNESPHYRFIKGDKQFYEDYLKESWKSRSKTEKDIQLQMKAFKYLIDDILSNGQQYRVNFYTRPNGDRIIIDGNHRTSIGLAYNLDITKNEVSIQDYLRSILSLTHNKQFGINKLGLPYQSIFNKHGGVILNGRRNDVLERHNLIKEFIDGNSIVDMGCNLGMSSYMAKWDGATEVLGIEYANSITTAAILLGVVLNTDIKFKNIDLSKPVNTDRTYDMGFCFSIDKHVKNDNVLLDNINKFVDHTLIFETHEHSKMPDNIKNSFEQCDHLGKTFNNRRDLFILRRQPQQDNDK